MNAGNDTNPAAQEAADRLERPVFSAVIRPHRSLGPKGFRVVLLLLCLGSLVVSLPFVIAGVWPVVGFFGLDILGLYVALKASDRQGRAFEILELSAVRLLIRKVSHRGEARQWVLNPLWTRLERITDDEFGLQTLTVSSRQVSVTVARDLSPAEREHFADSFARALAAIKRGY